MSNDKLNLDYNCPDAIPCVITKVARVSLLECTDDDLKKINKYTLLPVTADEVIIFKATIADNEQDDRNFMPFDLKALQDLKKLYPGKTMLKDHKRLADNQIARIYDTELIQNANKQTELGELHTELIAKIYMVKTDSNKDLITEIMGGIKKEVSTSTVPEKMICNVCGCDRTKEYCSHYLGQDYDIADTAGRISKRRCKIILHGAKEAYELSFVAVPAQPRAGTHKTGFSKPVTEPENVTNNTQIDNQLTKTDIRIFSQRVKNAESFFNFNNQKEKS